MMMVMMMIVNKEKENFLYQFSNGSKVEQVTQYM